MSFYNGTDSEGKRGVSPGYKLDFPDSKGNCADCHAPSAALSAPGQTDLNKVFQRVGVNAKGVHCDFCHKIQDVKVSNQPVQDWQSVRVASDNRIKPKETDTSVYRFELPVNNSGGIVAIKLIYRRAFKPLADAKKWKLEDIVMKEREISF